MTREQWEVFVPLLEEFLQTLNVENDALYPGDSLAHELEVDANGDVWFYSEYCSRCGSYEYTQHKAHSSFFIDGEKEIALQALKEEREEAARRAAWDKEQKQKSLDEATQKHERKLLESLKQKYETGN